jgi:hypothetical protein
MKQSNIILVIRFTLVLAIIASIYELSWMSLYNSCLTLFLTFIPNILSKKYHIKLPNLLQFFIILFIYASIFLGEVNQFYDRFWWWDSALHFSSGIALGFIGFLVTYILYKTNKIRTDPIFIAIFSLMFAISLGVFWEIYEFSADQFSGADMQKARDLNKNDEFCDTRVGVIDTMFDLILDTSGALIAAVAGYLFIIKKKAFFFGSIVHEFEKENQYLFRIEDENNKIKRKKSSKNNK